MSSKPKAIKIPPSKEELAGRLTNVREMMEKESLDYYVSYDPTNIYYLTNFAFYIHERPFILIIPRRGLPKMLIPLLERGHFKLKTLTETEIVSYNEFPAPKGENWFDLYQSLLDKNAKIGIESVMPMGIAQQTPGNKIVSDIIEELRLIKSDYEIGRIYHACRIINKGQKKIFKMCRPGVLEFAIFQEVSSVMTSKIIQDIPTANFKATSTVGAVWPPSISHDPHLVPDIFAPMEQGGPHVSIIQIQVDGYSAELERTFFLGSISDKAKELFQIMFDARSLAYDLVKPGAIMSEVDKKVRKFITGKGYGDNIIHRTGHGLGITEHEAPYLAEGYDRKLEPGMVISIEPGIYVPGLGGFRHSDTVLVTSDGNLKLTQALEELEDVIIPL